MENNFDIIIVGAGASGAAAAWNLSKKFQSIACIEQGDWVDPSQYPSTRLDWEIRKSRNYNPLPNERKLPADYEIDDKNSPIAIANFNAVGGSTILYSGHFPRMHPSDFKTKSLDGVGQDWPIEYRDLEPFYNINDEVMGVSGLTGDPAYPDEINNLMPPVDLGHVGEIMAHAFNKLDWHWWPSYSAIITREKDGRGRCINLGPCNTGCPQGAKSSVDITYWPRAIKNGVKLFTNSRVSNVITDKQDKVKGVLYKDNNGKEHFMGCKILILACNGIGTPRILLNSQSNVSNNSLANSSGQVGKNLMLHPLGFVEGIFDKDLDSDKGPHGSCILSQEFYETSPQRDFKRGFTMQILKGPGPIETVKSGIQRRLIEWGESHHKSFENLYKRSIGISIICEDLPEESNMVTLHENMTDSSGIPCPKISYTMSENTKKMMSFGINRAKEVMSAADANEVYSFGPVRNTGWHLMGTARMGKSRTDSVVNSSGMCHEVENLYIVDSSVFPTSASVNPASTLQALSLLFTEGIKKNSSNIK